MSSLERANKVGDLVWYGIVEDDRNVERLRRFGRNTVRERERVKSSGTAEINYTSDRMSEKTHL